MANYLCSEKVTLWCGLHAEDIIGPYIFKTESGANVIENGERCKRTLFATIRLPQVNKYRNSLSAEQFLQNSSRAYTSCENITLLGPNHMKY